MRSVPGLSRHLPDQGLSRTLQLDARRCISYLTIEHRGHIAREFRKPMGNRIYGCDDCLAVCPWNKFASEASEAKLQARARFDSTGAWMNWPALMMRHFANCLPVPRSSAWAATVSSAMC